MPIGKVTKKEEKKLKKGICPDCGGTEFFEGPHGGLAINIKCANKKCNARFNVCTFFTSERIS